MFRGEESRVSWNLAADDAVATFSAPGSAGGLGTILGTLMAGATVIVPDPAKAGVNATLRQLEHARLTVLSIPAPVARTLSRPARARDAFAKVRAVRFGATFLARADVEAVTPSLPPDCALSHAYATTEITFIAKNEVDLGILGADPTIPAGRIADHCEFAILGPDGDATPSGRPGEIVVRGPYIALGEWVGGRLVPGRIRSVPGRPTWRAYRTGDLAIIRPDGMLSVLGRVDRQIKINGAIVQPAEIELLLKSDPDVMDAAVVCWVREDTVTVHGFVARAVASDGLSDRLHRLCERALPTTSRPSSIEIRDTLPKLAGGKTDIEALLRQVRGES